MDLYDTNTLIEVISVQKPASTYWLDLCFPRELQFDTQEILFDQIPEYRNLAPFVAPNVQGRVMRERGFTTKSFRPAYIKPKGVINPFRAIPRRAGEKITGSLSLEQRFDAIVAEQMATQRQQVERRWEWMAARAIIDGEVTVAGDDYPSQTVEFGRHTDLTVQLTGADRWSQNTATPLTDLEDLRTASFRLAGTAIDRVTMGLTAWGYFTSFSAVTDLLKADIRGSTTEFNRSIGTGQPFEFRGFLAGQGGVGRLELWTYNDTYHDESDVAQPFLDQNTVVGTGPGISGYRCFGAIQDIGARLQAMSMFPKMWNQEDPSATYAMTQSAPLMVPAQPNGCFSMSVHI